MIQVGRFAKVRGIGATGISPAYILERRRAQWPAALRRYRPDDWCYDAASGLVLPTLRGGIGPYLSGVNAPGLAGFGYINFSATQTTSALSSSYVYTTSGTAIAAKITPHVARTLTAIYFFIASYTGTAASVTDINAEVRNDSGAATKPGSSVLSSGSVNPGATTGWKSVTGLSAALSAGTTYWAVVGDANGGATNFATVVRNVGSGAESINRMAGFFSGDGFTTNPTGVNNAGSLVLVYSDGFVQGTPFTASANPANNTNRRGFRADAGFFGDIQIHGYTTSTSLSALAASSGMELWLDNTGPSGTPAWTTNTGIQYPPSGTAGYAFTTHKRIRAGTPFRLVFTFSGVSTSVPRLQIGTGADANLRAARYGNGHLYWGQASGTSDWSLDNTNEYPMGQIWLGDVWDAYHGSSLGLSRFVSGRQIPAGL